MLRGASPAVPILYRLPVASAQVKSAVLLAGLNTRIANETGMPVRIADNPLDAVALGSGQCLESFEALRGVLFSSSRD